MERKQAVQMLSALAQETRLAVFRLLVGAGDAGKPATTIAEAIGIRQNLMSAHLSILHKSGLTRTRRDGRKIYHAVDERAAQELFVFLIQECCGGEQDKCIDVLERALVVMKQPSEATAGALHEPRLADYEAKSA